MAATLSLDKGLPIETLQRTESLPEHLENRMRVSDANAHLSSFENPKNILNERTLVSRLDPNLVKLLNPNEDNSAERTLEGEGVTVQPIIRAQVGCNDEERLRERLEKPLAQSRV